MDSAENGLTSDAKSLLQLDSRAATWAHPTLPGIRADLGQIVRTHKDSYLAASPWPHVVLDDLIDPALIAAAEEEELEPSLSLEIDRSYRKVKAESPEPNGPAASQILESIGNPEFVAFLEELTGVEGLIPDPTHYWAGLHVNPPVRFKPSTATFGPTRSLDCSTGSIS